MTMTMTMTMTIRIAALITFFCSESIAGSPAAVDGNRGRRFDVLRTP
jgi:hypothetical protein